MTGVQGVHGEPDAVRPVEEGRREVDVGAGGEAVVEGAVEVVEVLFGDGGGEARGEVWVLVLVWVRVERGGGVTLMLMLGLVSWDDAEDAECEAGRRDEREDGRRTEEFEEVLVQGYGL